MKNREDVINTLHVITIIHGTISKIPAKEYISFINKIRICLDNNYDVWIEQFLLGCLEKRPVA